MQGEVAGRQQRKAKMTAVSDRGQCAEYVLNSKRAVLPTVCPGCDSVWGPGVDGRCEMGGECGSAVVASQQVQTSAQSHITR